MAKLSGLTGTDDAFKQKIIDQLSKRIPPGTRLYTVSRRQARLHNGASVVSVLIVEDGVIHNISGDVCDCLDLKWDDSAGVKCSCAFLLQRDLSYMLHGSVSKGIPKNKLIDHHPRPTPKRFKAGYGFIHTDL